MRHFVENVPCLVIKLEQGVLCVIRGQSLHISPCRATTNPFRSTSVLLLLSQMRLLLDSNGFKQPREDRLEIPWYAETHAMASTGCPSRTPCTWPTGSCTTYVQASIPPQETSFTALTTRRKTTANRCVSCQHQRKSVPSLWMTKVISPISTKSCV